MKKKIMKVFKVLGFKLEKIDEDGYGFKYEGKKYLWVPNDNDADFLHITVPVFFDLSKIEEQSFYETIFKFNATVKYVQANYISGNLWLSSEREMFDENNETLEAVLTSIIVRLDASLGMIKDMLTKAIDRDNEYNRGQFLVDDIEMWEEVEDNND